MANRDKATIDHINDLFSYATAGIETQRAKWRKNYKYWKATNKIERPSYKDNPRVPLIFRYTNGIISMMTDQNPKYVFMPQEEGDIGTADALQQVLGDYYWDKLSMSSTSEDLIWWAMAISGSGLIKWGIDRSTKDYFVKALNSFCCYPDPMARNFDQMNFFFYASMWSLNDCKRSFERGGELKPQAELHKLFDDDDPILSPWARTSEKSENLIKVLDKSAVKLDYGRVMVYELWEKDTSMVKIPIDSDTIAEEHDMIRAGQVPKVADDNHHPEHIKSHTELAQSILDSDIPSEYAEIVLKHIEEHQDHPNALETERLKYPRGKLTTVANNIVLEPTDQAPLGLALSKMDYIRNPMDFWGQTIGEYVHSLQDSRERRKRQISDHADRTANPREFYLPQSGYDPNEVKNIAAEQVPVAMLGAVWWEDTPNLNTYLLEDMIDSEKCIEKVMGYPEVMQGMKPTGDTSGVLIQELKESLAPEMRKAVRHFEWCICDVARGLIEMLQYESPTKIYTIMGNDFKPVYIKQDELNLGGQYDIRIMAGSTLPTSRQAKANQAIMFYEKGLYTRRAALKYLDDPQAAEVMKEFDIMQQQQQVIEEQQNIIKELGGKIEDTENIVSRLLQENERIKYAAKEKSESD